MPSFRSFYGRRPSAISFCAALVGRPPKPEGKAVEGITSHRCCVSNDLKRPLRAQAMAARPKRTRRGIGRTDQRSQMMNGTASLFDASALGNEEDTPAAELEVACGL